MTTLKEKIKNLSLGAKAGLVGLGLATIVGTFGGNEGGLAPFYNKKVGTWGGINLGAYNSFTEGSKFYGISLGLVNLPEKDEGFNYAKNYFYGVQVGVGNGSENLTGAQIGVGNIAGNLTGAQIGLFNYSYNLKGVQIGLGNRNQKGWNVLLGFANGENKK